ncbi:MAG: MipA/OmpV family protein [Candidatus Sphingomonas colombiensis]|nr:MipA/OmpV family protein [Sphingomonas sp.]WEK44241.1 MAG: MipA/OmpV family protein [Sphingomonas sp.]
MRALHLIALAGAVAATPALAQQVAESSAEDLSRDTVTVGVAASYLTDYEGSNHYSFFPLPGAIGSINGYSFTVLGNRASVDLIRDKPGQRWDFEAGPIAVIDFNRNARGSINDPRVRALPTRGLAVELGGYVGIGKTGVITSDYDKLSLSLSYRHDITGVNGSAIVSPTVNYITPLSRKTAIALFVTAEHVSKRYVTAYFDVTPADSLASGLPVFSGSGGWKSWSAGAIGTVSVSGDLLHGWKLIGGVTYRRITGDAADSPLVTIAGSPNQWLGALGVAYTF